MNSLFLPARRLSNHWEILARLTTELVLGPSKTSKLVLAKSNSILAEAQKRDSYGSTAYNTESVFISWSLCLTS